MIVTLDSSFREWVYPWLARALVWHCRSTLLRTSSPGRSWVNPDRLASRDVNRSPGSPNTSVVTPVSCSMSIV